MDLRREVTSTAPRWTHTCAWDGRELDGTDYVQISAHERVCLLHHPQFVTWLRDKSKTMYRTVIEDEAPSEARGIRKLDKVVSLLQARSKRPTASLGMNSSTQPHREAGSTSRRRRRRGPR